MAKINNEEEIIRDLELRLNDANTSIHWYKMELQRKEEQEVDRLIELMETKTFSDWFNENVIKDNPEINDSINDMVEDVIDYSDTFRERVNDIISTETYELKEEIKEMVTDEIEYQVNTMSQDMVEYVVAKQLKKLKVVIDAQID